MRIKKDNIIIRSATLNDTIQLNKWWNDGGVMEQIIKKYQGEINVMSDSKNYKIEIRVKV